MIQMSMTPVSTRPLPPRSEGWSVLAGGGRFAVRLTRDPGEIAAGQRLRYQVFYEEMAAQATPAMAALGRDFDEFDQLCDHLMVHDLTRAPGDQVVGTYRLFPQALAESHGQYYSESEYALRPTIDRLAAEAGGRLLELGRSCVHPEYRNNATIQLLWRGITTYMVENQISYMFGCASLPGVDPDALAVPLSYLHHNHLAPPEMRIRALEDRYVPMNRLPAEGLDMRRALHAVPPLIKAYLRLGAYIGDGAVIDHQFGTTDVFILVPVARIAPKYYNHFGRDEFSVVGSA